MIPVDFSWDEMVRVMRIFGFWEIPRGKTGGSRRKFTDVHKNVIAIHKPHPGNIVKQYVIRDIINSLTTKGYIS